MIVKLFEYLQDNKIDVYFVGQHQGECKKPYVVLKDDGVNSTNSKVGKGYIIVRLVKDISTLFFLYLKINLLIVIPLSKK